MTTQILVVDDERHMLRLASYVLESAGYEVLAASDAREALVFLEAESPSLVLCDIAMPGMDGLELLRTIRANPRTTDLPVVMLTARGEDRDRLQAAAAGANGYLTKPFSSAEVLSEVAHHLSTVGGERGEEK